MIANGPGTDGQGTGGDSDPSGSGVGVTDYGSGYVFSGGVNTTEGSDGVTAEWSGDYDQPRLDNSTVTLTLHNLPDHYGLNVLASVYHEVSNTSDDGDGTTNVVTLSGLGEDQPSVRVIGLQYYQNLGITSDHTGDSVTLTLTGTNWVFAGDSWGDIGISVQLSRYKVEVDPSTVVVGETKDVRFVVTKQDGLPAWGRM